MSGRWASRPWQWVVVAAGIAAVIVAVAWPGLAPYTVGVAAGLLLATGIRHLIWGRKTRTAPAVQPVTGTQQTDNESPGRP